MHPDLVIGIDSSTSATKAIAWNRVGQVVAEGRAPIPLSNPQAGWFEQDPADWWGACVTALKGCTAQIDPSRIAAVAISNQRESYGYFDAHGQALRPATLWLDQRSEAQVHELARNLGPDTAHRISGKPGDPTPCLYRFMWFAEHMPQIQNAAHCASEAHGFLAFQLSGDWVTSTASADPMGLLDMARMDWSETLIKAASYQVERLPRLHRPGHIMSSVSAKAAAATGLPAGVPVVAGGGDGQCAGTGVNVMAPGRAYINMGTAVVSGAYGTGYVYDRSYRTMSAVNSQGYIYECAMKAGTFIVDWVVRELMSIDPKSNSDIFRTLEAEAAASPIGANGVVLVPYWSGCMTPYWDGAARGVIAGLSASNKRGDIYRAVLEGMALEQAILTESISRAAAQPIDHYVAIGGGSSSDLWLQILADATGVTVRRSSTVEASSLGAACAAATGAGWYDSIADAAGAMAGQLTAQFTPDPARHARYAELLAIYRDLWPAMTQWNTRIAAFADRH
jgi:xylulokinase